MLRFFLPHTLTETLRHRLDAIEKNLAYANQIGNANHVALAALKDLTLQQQTHELQNAHPNSLNKFGKQCFSQTDEDGITLEIIRRLNIDKGVYAEFGVGDGLENNTLILAALGWRGFWVGGDELAFSYTASPRFSYIKDWITLENIAGHTKTGLDQVNAAAADVISLDLDGNDIYFVQHLLEQGFLPKLFIIEYNAKFPPPVRFQIQYDAAHQWAGDDYFGASLSSFVALFAQFGYRLVCCNAHTGANAFFVRNEFSGLFEDVPVDVSQIYVGPRYHLYNHFGHRKSAKVVETILAG